jgi:hypothetical protein
MQLRDRRNRQRIRWSLTEGSAAGCERNFRKMLIRLMRTAPEKVMEKLNEYGKRDVREGTSEKGRGSEEH